MHLFKRLVPQNGGRGHSRFSHYAFQLSNALLNNIPTRRFQIAKLLTDQSSHLTSMSIPIVTAATLAAAGIEQRHYPSPTCRS
ncbi:hypothetical protein BCR33DRAFT_131072 [Rhizoclosmatium globosum]|uniref:Uncharacterized protein n=1 Tax=Rhizoclosmatium globosum TaxID=329046 RepID=A0A1Y2CHP9_9FUNG|nr:hypothetical protein BCR33DRAFT_131072 [Rhizoclosmatium globosum]|eukprot:ORY46559.1 hypothetical protein BCR33DRAFT_131072 [Rhizoclosmatium globosum]